MKFIRSLVLALLLVASVSAVQPHTANAATPLPRPVVMDHTLKTPSGDLLRGTNVSYGANWPDLTAEANKVANWQRSKDFGLNLMRVTNRDAEAYKINETENPATPLPVWSIADNLKQLDKLVDIAEAQGMYIMITPNSRIGTFSKQYLIDFWSQAAARYKNRTNVFYEMQNEPVKWSADDYKQPTIDDLADVYKIMRAGAPDTPILSLCVAVASDDIRPLVNKYTQATGIVWSDGKDLVSFHPYGTSTYANIGSLVAAYPAMNTENGHPRRDAVQTISPYTYHTEMFEKKGISWVDFWMTRTDDVFARWTYNLIDDAKVGNYYWKAPDDIITDDLNDLSMTDSSTNVMFVTGNPGNFDGDTSRIKRAAAGTSSIVYKIAGTLKGIGSMKVNAFYNDSTIGIKFYVSEDGVSWRQVTRNNTTPVATAGGWKQTYLTFANSIPVNTKYIKLEMVAGVVNQIGSVQFNSWDVNHYGGVDELNTWNFIHSKSGNMVTAATGDLKNSFESDPDRVMKNSNAAGNIVYKAFSDVYDGFYLTTFVKGSGQSVHLYTSPDATTWTEITSITPKVVQEGTTGWSRKDYTLDYSANPLPSGTQYIKVEIPATSGTGYNNTEIGSFTWWTHYN